MKVLMVFGTRPEAIKMCPLAVALDNSDGIECVICLTGQHKEMLSQALIPFSVKCHYNLDIMKEGQQLTSITASVLEGMDGVLEKEKPDLVLVHGDTTTSLAAALAAFYKKIPVGHVEAGLRTGNLYSPYPEELNRLLTDRISTYLFAPTENNKKNLAREGITSNVYVTGNTVIDSFQYTVQENYRFKNKVLRELDFGNKRVVLITAHRRENLGQPLKSICSAVKRLAREYKDIDFVYPVHLNPAVRDTVFKILNGDENVYLIDPIEVFDMHNLLARCYLVLTDSGGLQEEAPHFGKPVLVLRTETERPEAVEAGTVKVVGVSEDNIFLEARRLFEDRQSYQEMAKAVNPYGDGHSCERIAKSIRNCFREFFV